MLAMGLNRFSLKNLSSEGLLRFFRYSWISGASFKRFIIWGILAFEILNFLANPAFVLTPPGTVLAFESSALYFSALDRRSFMAGFGYFILINNSWLYGMVILGPGVRVATVSASQIKSIGYRINPVTFSFLLTYF